MGARRGNKFGWHSGVITAKDGKFLGDLYIQDDIVFSDVSAGTLGVTGGIDMQSTTSAIGIDMGGTHSTAAINIDGTSEVGLLIGSACTTAINVSAVQTDETGLDAAAVFQHGTYSTALAYGTQTAHLVLKSTCITAGVTGAEVYVFGDINKITTSADSTGIINVAYDYLSVGDNLLNGWATRGRVDITDSCTLGEQSALLGTLDVAANKIIAQTGEPVLAAAILDLTVNTGATVEQETTCLEVRPHIKVNGLAGSSSGIRINVNCSSANYLNYGLDIRSMSSNQDAAMRILATPASAALPIGIYMEGQDSSSSTITNAISLAGTVTNVLDFAEGDGSQGATVGTGTTAHTADAKIIIDIAGSSYEIPAYATGQITLSS